MDGATSLYPLAFSPITVGTMELDSRLVVSSHSGGGGSLLESEARFEQHCEYWVSRVAGGLRWVGGGPTFVRNPLIPGFEPTGIGANGPGVFRHPDFVERLGRFMGRLHDAGGFGSVQFVQQGGMPSAPSSTLSGHADHRIPHALDIDEVAWLVREYGESAALAAAGDADALELHANHDDVLQWFLSPRTNRRTDGYGGTFENRRRLLREVVESMRSHVDRPVTIGLRLCIDEMIDDGLTVDDCRGTARSIHRRRNGRLLQPGRRGQLGTGELCPARVLSRGCMGTVGRAGENSDEPAGRLRRARHKCRYRGTDPRRGERRPRGLRQGGDRGPRSRQQIARRAHRRDPSVHWAPGMYRPPGGRGPAIRVWYQSACGPRVRGACCARRRAEIRAGGRRRTSGNGVRRANGGTGPPRDAVGARRRARWPARDRRPSAYEQ